jgi:hypothetical protein
MKKFGKMKLGLMNSGIFVTEGVRNNKNFAEAFPPQKGLEEIVFSLTEDFFVKTHVHDRKKDSATLKTQKSKIVLSYESEEVDVSILPPLGFLKSRKTRHPMEANVSLEGYCLNLYLRSVGKKSQLNMTPNTALSIVRSAFEEGVADLVQINMDYCDAPDRGFKLFAPIVEDIKKNFRTFVGLRSFSPENMGTIDNIYASGVDLLVYPLEGFSSARKLEQVMAHEQVMEALEYAVSVFPQGTVSTELTFGDGDVQPVLEKIDQLTQKGIIPCLKLPNNGLQTKPELDRAFKVIKHLAEASERNKLILKWLYPVSQFVSPLDTTFFTETPKKARLKIRPVYQTILGKAASESFAALRRKLRVKNISDSYESAGL